MGKSSTKQTAQTQTTAPTDPAVTAAYENLLGKSQSLASQPLQLYGGQTVAPLNNLQNQAIGQIQNSGNIAAPYLTSAANYAQQSATPITQQAFTPQNVNQYYSPYQNDVINSTMALQNQQNQQQQQSLQGNITAAGAWGGDRSAVLQSQLAGQQKLADNSSIAGLENQGYGQALGQFNTQNQMSLQQQQANNQNAAGAAYSLGSLGTAMQNSSLSGANALLNAGTLQQQVAQENLNVPYEQYLQTQAFPYQNLDFLASMFPGIQQGTGTTSSGTGTQSSTQPFSIFKAGGRTHLADGGQGGNTGFSLASPGPNMLEMMENGQMNRDAGGYQGASLAKPPQLSTSYIPQAQPGTDKLSTPGLNMSFGGGDSPASSGGGLLGDFSKLQGASGMLGSFGSSVAGDAGMSGVADMGAGIGGDVAGAGSGALGFLSDAASGAGDAIMSALAFLKQGGRAKLADGGEDDDTGMDSVSDIIPHDQSLADQSAPVVTEEDDSAPVGSFAAQPADTTAPQPDSLASTPTWDDGTPVAQGANDNGDQPDQLGLQHAAKTVWTEPQGKADWGHVILSGLASALANRSLGHGLAAGINEYDSEMDQHPVVDHSGSSIQVMYGGKGSPKQLFDTGIPTEAAMNAKTVNDYRTSNMQMNQQTREDAIKERQQAAADAVAQRQAAAVDATENRKTQLQIAQQNADAGRWTFAGTDPATKKPIFLDSRTGQTKVGNTEIGAKPGTTNFRSLPAMVANKYMQEHPNATTDDAELFASNFGAQQKATRDFATGKQGQALNSFNVGLSHLNTLSQLGQAMNNGDVRLINQAKNTFANQFGQPAPTNFNAAKSIVGDEIVKAIVGSGGGVTDRENAQKTIDTANSWPQLQGAIETYKNLMAGQLHGLKQQYESTTGRTDFMNRMSPEAQGVYGHYYPASPAGGTNPQGGANAAPAPQPGTISKGYRFKGGNPANPQSWEKAA